MMVPALLRRLLASIPLSADGRRRAARPRVRGYRPALLVLEDRWLPSTILWTGDAGDGLWQTAGNWAGGVVPGAADDAVIDDTSPPVTVTLGPAGRVSVQSLTSSKDFVLAGSLTLTAGSSSLGRAFTLNSHATLGVDGATTSLTATGTTTIRGVNLLATNGGTIGLVGDATYDETGLFDDPVFQADGATSRLDLSGVTVWRGPGQTRTGTTSNHITVQATNGGTVDLPNVTSISVGNSYFQALDGGQINLTGLTSFAGANRSLGVNALDARRGGAAIVAPALASLSNVNLRLAGDASLSVGQLGSFVHGDIRVSRDANLGGVLTLPVTTIDEPALDGPDNVSFVADGAGSRLDLSGVTAWHAAGNVTLRVQATNGGAVDLSHVADIANVNTLFQALDGGQVNLAGLTSFTAPVSTPPSALDARRGGAAIVAPALTGLTNVTLSLGGSASLGLGHLSSFTHGNITVFQDDGLPGVLALPVTTIDETGFTRQLTYQVSGFRSRLDLSRVTTWRGAGSATNPASLGVLVQPGSTVDLSRVAAISTGNTILESLGGTINLAALTSFTGDAGPNGNALELVDGATLALDSGTTFVVNNTFVLVNAAGTITANAVRLTGSSVLTGGATNPSVLTVNNLINDTRVQPISTGTTVVIDGNYTQTGSLTGLGTLTVTGLLTWMGGSMTGGGTVNANGGLVLGGTGDKTLDGATLNLAGNSTWGDAGNLVLANNARINNQANGVFTIANDQTLSGSGSFNNLGFLNKASDAGGTTTIGVAFTNNGGTVTVASGTLSFSGDYTQNGGATVIGAGATLAAGGVVNLLGGTLSGSGVVNGNVINSGEIDLGMDGTAGTLTIHGNYTQTAVGVLNIGIGGTAGAEYDQLVVSGSVSLDGTLNVFLIGGFTPTTGDSFQIVTSGMALSGSFATANIDPRFMPPTYDPMDVTLLAS
jgi:hypothetical protein